jgi:ion channel-forming bestrophin family protein
MVTILFCRSSILRAIAVPVAFTTVFATLVCTYNAAIAKGIIKAALPQLVIPQALINLPSFCLSLLLVFRTNASYGRFDEARKMWGLMLNRSRDLARQSVTYFPPHAIAAKRMLARWTIAMQKSLLDVCRGDCDYKAFMGDTLRKEEMERILKSPHKVVYAL